MVRIFGNGVGWTANAPKLSSVGLWLNASKSESMLAATIFTLTGVFVPIALWSTRYFTTLPNVGRVKSSVDDLNGTGYCKHESSPCATICWGSASVPGFVRCLYLFSVFLLKTTITTLFRYFGIVNPPPLNTIKSQVYLPNLSPPMYSNVQYNKLNLCYATYHVLFQPTHKICVGFLLLFCCIDPSLCYIWPWYRILFYYHSDDCNQRVIISITCWSIHPGYFIFLLSPLLLYYYSTINHNIYEHSHSQ